MFWKECYSPLKPYILRKLSCRLSMFTYLHVQNRTRNWYLGVCVLGRKLLAKCCRSEVRSWRTQRYASTTPLCHACTRNEAFNNSLELVIKIFVVPMLFICICGEALWLADRSSLWCRWFARALYSSHCWRLWPILVCEIIKLRNSL